MFPRFVPLPGHSAVASKMKDDCSVSGSGEVINLPNALYPVGSNSSVPEQAWQVRRFEEEYEECMTDASFEDVGSTSFHGVSHPPEPVDTDCTRIVCVPIDQNKAAGKGLTKRFPLKGPLLEDVSTHVPGIKPIPAIVSPDESLDEDPNDSRASDSSGLSDETYWSNSTCSNKPHKCNNPRWKAILAIQLRDGKHFSEYAARFYAAEFLLALEYLNMQGIVYRDLKPENVLVREDGHIMLSDFDLSLRCVVSPVLTKISSMNSDYSKRGFGFCVQPACVDSTSMCIQPGCFLPRFFSQKSKRRSLKTRADSEPTAARSMSFEGTHEYLAPEIIKGEAHGSAVDWWTFGIFLHELLYGRTPFKGSGNRATLFNVVGQQLKFPKSAATSNAARDLIRGLLVKEPQHRLGTKRGATEIKQHSFFDSIKWALIRCSTPPELPRTVDAELRGMSGKVKPIGVSGGSSQKIVRADMKSGSKYLDFEFF